MMSWMLPIVLDYVVPLILTMLLGFLGVKVMHVKDALTTIADALADGKINKREFKDIVRDVKAVIGR